MLSTYAEFLSVRLGKQIENVVEPRVKMEAADVSNGNEETTDGNFIWIQASDVCSDDESDLVSNTKTEETEFENYEYSMDDEENDSEHDFVGYKTNYPNESKHIAALNRTSKRINTKKDDKIIPSESQTVQGKTSNKKVTAFCGKCKQSFTRLNSKSNHDRTYHGKYLTIFICDICGLESLYSRNIMIHYRANHNVEKSFKEIKSKKIKNTEKCKSKKHNRFELELTFLCLVNVSIISVQAERLKEFMKRTTKFKPKLKPATCSICGQVFKNGAKHLNVHLRKAHN